MRISDWSSDVCSSDLRNIILRSEIISDIRRRMTDGGFLEFQTPILTASSPEGARDFLVPARMHPGKFYALPQAPQQFKPLIMVRSAERGVGKERVRTCNTRWWPYHTKKKKKTK